MVGEDLTDEQSEFYENNFPNDNISSIEWQIIGWISYLLLELTAIHGGKINFDEFKSCDFIDFVSLDAKPKDYQNLRNKQCSILPQEFAVDFLEF